MLYIISFITHEAAKIEHNKNITKSINKKTQ